MPHYRINGKTYTIPEDKVDALEKEYPDAQLHYQVAGKSYTIPANKRKELISNYPDAQELGWGVGAKTTEVEQGNFMPSIDESPNPPLNAYGKHGEQRPEDDNVETNFWKGMQQTNRNIYKAGLWHSLRGEIANLFTGSSREEQAALSDIEYLESIGVDPKEYLANIEDAGFQHLYGMSREQFNSLDKKERRRLVNESVSGQDAMSKEAAEEMSRQRKARQSVIDAYQDALQEAGGDLDKAKEILRAKAENKTWGDIQLEKANEIYSSNKQLEGAAKWGATFASGIPSAAAIGLSFLTKGKTTGVAKWLNRAAKGVGHVGMGAMTAGTAGLSMIEAREHGATNWQTWTTGIADGLIEYVTERIPFNKLTKGVFSAAKTRATKELTDIMRKTDGPGRKELEKLVEEANKKLGGKLLNGGNVKDWLAQTAAEGLSEAAAEGLQTMTSMIYLNPEEYPTFAEVMNASWEGMKGGLALGGVLGGAGKTVEHSLNKERRKQQGFVNVGLAETEDGKTQIGEIIGRNDENGKIQMLVDGEVQEVNESEIAYNHQFTYNEFESGRYRALEDEAIADGTVSDAQVAVSADRVGNARQDLERLMTEAGMTDEQKDAVFADLENGDLPDFSADAKTLWDAADAYSESLKRDKEIQSARDVRAESERKAVLDAMQQQMGSQFWQNGSTTMLENGMEIIEPPMIEYGTMQNGKQIYILSTPNENGEVSAITDDGEKIFLRNTDLQGGTTIIPLQEFLDSRVKEQKSTAESERMAQEAAPQIDKVKQEVLTTGRVNLGTEDSPIDAVVVGNKPGGDGVMLQTAQGIMPYTWEQIAEIKGEPIRVLTDAQMAAAEAAEIEAAEAAAMAERAQNNEQMNRADQVVDNAVQMENMATETPLPTNPDGSVNEDALFNESPARWAKWNDEQSQDGGASSAQYIAGKLARAQEKLAKLQTMYDAEDSLNKRRGIQTAIAEQERVVADLEGVAQKYAIVQPVAETEQVQVVTPAQQTLIDLFSDDSLSEEEIEAYVDANVSGSQSDLDKHLNKAPKMGRDMEKFKSDRAKHAEKTKELTAVRDYWREVKSYLGGNAAEMSAEPQNALEAAAYELSRKDGLKLLPKSFRHHTGYGRGEQVKFLSILRKKENGGMTLEAAGERLMAEYPEFFDENDPNTGLNAILDVLQSAGNSGGLANYIANARQEVARQESDAVRGAIMQQVEDAKNGSFEYYEGDMTSLVEDSKSTSQGLIKKVIAPANERLISDLGNEGIDIDESYNHTIDNSGVRHILKNHGTEKEYKRGQIPITEADFELIGDIVNNYDEVLTDKNKRGQDVITYVKSYPDGTTYYVEEVRVGRKELAADTMYKRKNRLTDANGTETTQISDLSVPEESSLSVSEGSLNGHQSDGSDLVPTPSGESSESKDSNNPAISNESEEKINIEDYDDLPPDFRATDQSQEEIDILAPSAEVIAKIAAERREAVHGRIAEWEKKLGIKVNVLDSYRDVTHESAKEEIAKGGKVWGWFDPLTGQIYIYTPDYIELQPDAALEQIDKTILHEGVSHKGLREFLGKEKFDELCDKVWSEVMDAKAQKKFINYPGVNGDQRKAADEYMAHISEDMKYDTVWDKIANFFKNLLGIETKVSDKDIKGLLKQSYANLAKNGAKTNPDSNQQSEGNVRFRTANGSLVGMHNISEDKLRKGIKQGGLANPSTAVVNIAEYILDGYGDISLIMPSSMVDADTGDNVGTYTGDAWTPTYPPISRQVDERGWNAIKDVIRSVVPEDSSLYYDIINGLQNYLEDNRSSKMEFVFLKTKGIEPEIAYKGADGFVGMRNLEAILGVQGLRDGLEAYERYKSASPMAKRSFNMWLDAGGNKQAHRELKEPLKKEPKLAEVLKLNEDVSFAEFDSFTYDIFRKEQDAGKIDTYDTMGAAARYVDANNLRGEFETWLESLMEQAGAKEVFFAGYTRSGERIYKDNTLENVSRHMRMQGRTNAHDDHGLSATKSALLQRLTSLSQIRKNRARLQNETTYNKEYDALKDRLWSVISQLADMQEISSNQFMNVDYAESRLQEAITKKNPVAYLNKEYGYEIEPSGEYAKELNSFIKDVQQMPAKYFETKFERPVYLNEFAAAVIPTTTSEDIKQAVSEAGLPIFEYDSSVEGSRREATLKATEEEGIRFRTLGEKGAANLDKAEEATIRLDNLAVARQMEEAGKDAKAIKLATGWERGADNLWRYEVSDDFDLTELENRLQENLDGGLSKTWGIIYPSDLGDLTKAYPDFNVDIMVWVGDEFENTGEYSPATEGDETTFGKPASIEVKAKTVADIKDVLVHEIQHAIQEKEGFAEGGSVFGLRDKLSSELDKRVARIKGLRAEGRDVEADELMSMSKGLAEAVINNDADTYQNYRKLAGEVEARNVSARLGMSEQKRRESLLSETERVAREDQIILMDGLGVSEMGSRVDRRMLDIENELSGTTMTETQKTIYNVFIGKQDKQPIAVQRKDGMPTIIMEQGADNKSGSKHAIYKHYGTGIGSFTAKDVLLIPEIVNNGTRKQNGNKVVYELTKDGVRYRVVTYLKTGNEIFNNFYTNRKNQPSQQVNAQKSDTQSALASEELASADKDTNNSENSNTRFRITPEQDATYMAAVESGDMETAQRMVNEAARLAGYDSSSDYQGSLAFNGAAPSGYAYYDTKEERIEAWENGLMEDDQTLGDYKDAGIDISNLGWSLTSPTAQRIGDKYTRESIKNLADAVNSDSRKIKVYRAVDADIKEDSIRNGDWVTPSRAYAEYHIGLQDWKSGKIIEQEVDIDDIWWDGNDINEWGYNDGKGYTYKNTPNNKKLLAPVTYDDNGNVIPLSERFNEQKEDIRFRTTEDINNQFNSEFQQQIDGTLPSGHVYRLGMPSRILRSAGIPNLPIEMASQRLVHKSNQANHPFELSEVTDLPRAIQNPLGVFRGATHIGSNVILTELRQGNKNFVVAVQTNKQKGRIQINNIRSIHPRTTSNIISWINENLMDYADNANLLTWIEEKIKSRDYLNSSNPAEVRKSLVSAAKIVENFENPNIEDDVLFSTSNNNQAIFVSNAAKAVEGIKQEKATPEQWLKMIEKNGGLKAGEDKWMGLSDWLKSSDKKTLTKQEVLDFINENMIVIEEVHYGEVELDGLQSEFDEIYDQIIDGVENGYEDEYGEEYEDNRSWEELRDDIVMSPAEKAWEELNSRYHGGDDFDMAFSLDDRMQIQIDDPEAAAYFLGIKPINDTRLGYTTERLTNKHEIALTIPTVDPWNETDNIHFGDAGDGRAVAWIRFGDTYGYIPEYAAFYDFQKKIQKKYFPDREISSLIGNDLMDLTPEERAEFERLRSIKEQIPFRESRSRKVLVIDEIQSKRHQEGREKGYARGPKVSLTELKQKAQDFEQEMIEKYHPSDLGLVPFASAMSGVWTEEESNTYSELTSAIGNAAIKNSGIPDAPFDKNWHELAMKRMLRYAAENGYDVIAWTKGEQQAERYNIGEVIDSIYYGNLNGNKIVRLTLYGADNQVAEVDSEGRVVAVHSGSMIQEGMSLADIVGKEIALKIMNNEGEKISDDDYKLSGEGLRVGGEGMKGFYDKILPAFMNKYGKKWGIKVEDIALPGLEAGSLTMHSVPVTEEMKSSVMEGQVMFRTSNGYTPEEVATINEYLPGFSDYYSRVSPLENGDVRLRTKDEAKRLLVQMQDNAEVLTPRQLTEDIWKNEIEGKTFESPIGDVKLGPNQYNKNINKGRSREFGMLLPTIERPDLIFEESAPEDGAERQTKYVFVKTFYDENGEMHINYASISVQKEDMEVVESSHRLRDKQVLNKIEKEQMLWNRFASDSTSSASSGSIDQSNALSSDKDSNNSANYNTSEENIRYRTRTAPAPTKTQEVYKLMRLGADGRLYPLFIGNTEAIELGTWYDADSPNLGDLTKLPSGVHLVNNETGESMTLDEFKTEHPEITIKGKRPNVAAINWATENGARWIEIEDKATAQRRYGGESRSYYNLGINGSGQVGQFAMRPGWHAGSLPTMRQIGKGKDKNLRDDSFVWVKGRIPADVDYQAEADANPDKDIPTHIPTDGFYMKATNANAKASQADKMGWYVAGSFIADEIMSDADARSVIDSWNAEHPDAKVEYDYPRESGREFDPARGGLVETDNQGRPKSEVIFRTRRPDQSAEGFCNDCMRDYLKKYGSLTIIRVIPVNEDTAKEFGYTLEELKELDGLYLGKKGIAIFAKDTVKDSDKVESTIFHESIHHLAKRYPDLIKTGEFFWNAAEKNDALAIVKAHVEDNYKDVSQEKRYEEMLCFTMEFYAENGGLDTLISHMSGQRKQDVEFIVNKTNYGRFGKTDGVRKDSTRKEDDENLNPENGRQSESTSDESGKTESGILFRTTGVPAESVVEDGLRLTPEQFTNLAAKIFKAMPEDVRREVVDDAKDWDLEKTTFQMSARLAEKATFSDEEVQLAKTIAQAVEDAVLDTGVKMQRPLTTNEALWMLYQAVNPVSEYDLVGNARMAVVADNLGFSPKKAEHLKMDEDDIRFRVSRSYYADSAANMYNKEQRSAWGRLRESFQDMHRSVDNLMQAIEKASGKAAESWENVVMALNRLSSKNLADKQKFLRDRLKPMWEKVLEIVDKHGKGIEDIERYMMLKHGLERNKVLAARDAMEFYRDKANKKIASIKKDGSLSAAEKKAKIQDVEDVYKGHVADINAETDAKYLELRKKDYGGLTALFSDFTDFGTRDDYETEEQYQAAALAARQPKYKTLAETENAAKMEVGLFESEVGTLADELWQKVNAATKDTLKHQYDHGMLTREQYDRVKDMFEYYVPLRGFSDNTAEDMYSYYSSGQQSKFANPLQSAKGRKTQAESPLGWIGSMAESAIQMDNKNDAKLRLYYFAVNRPNNDLLRISETWYEWTGEYDADGKKIFEPVYPSFSGAVSGDALEQKMEAFDSMMEAQAMAGNAFRGKQGLDIKGAVIRSPKGAPEHIITVKVAGKDYSIIVNGNPRAAQAINGLLNIDKADDNAVYRGFRSVLRLMSGLSTSLNPEFWISNFQRDMMFAFLGTNIRNDAEYTREFAKNYAKAFKVISYLRKNKKGELGTSETENYYREFAENGGITGYTVLTNNAEYDKMLREFAKDQRKSKFVKGVKGALEYITDFGEAIEQVSRFAAYMTARKAGRDIEQAIYDAKEVTVNFNRKGSGKAISWEEAAQMRNRKGKPLNWMEKVFFVGASGLSPIGRSLYMFFNAATQGLRTAAKLAHDHPGRSAAWAGIFMTMGLVNALLHAMFDDDDDYLDMPDYERRNNLLLGGKGVYLKWALPQEVRPFYAISDIFVNHMMGRSPHKDITLELASVFAELLPVNTVGAEGLEGTIGALVPSPASPIYELLINKDYKGSPIYREMPWIPDEQQKKIPAYTRAYKSTGKFFINVSEMLNNLSGGDYATAGGININPAAVEHIVEGYGGGLMTTVNKVLKTMGIIGDQEFSVRNTPFLSRFVTINDERYRNSHTTDLFEYYKAIADDVNRRLGEYTKNGDRAAIEILKKSDDFGVFQIFYKYKGMMKYYDESIKRAKTDEERRNIMTLQDAERKRMIEDIANFGF